VQGDWNCVQGIATGGIDQLTIFSTSAVPGHSAVFDNVVLYEVPDGGLPRECECTPTP
jgi:hypothetical protein